ncbi:MAG TPA: hypothetical protein VIM41_14640 [Gammaproteobacteria bacterium]
MNFLPWYLTAVLSLVVAVSAWRTVTPTQQQPFASRWRFFAHAVTESLTSALAYWCLVFVLALAIATALWLIALLLIWVPSDFFRNYVGLDVFSPVLQHIKPFIYRSASSPGITSVPLLDYLSLYSAFVFGPWFGIWSIMNKRQKQNTLAGPTPGST